MGEIEPDGQYLPDDAEHDTQSNAPKVVENLPTGQAIHSAEPASLVYLPATHSTHALAPEEGEYLAWVHRVHVLDEAEEEIDPAEHK